MEELVIDSKEFFLHNFGHEPDRKFLSPGRINIIGEHVDYNNGFVLPAAIDRYVCITISTRDDDLCVLISQDLSERHEFKTSDKLVPVEQMWANYFLGVLEQIKLRGFKFGGFELTFTSNVPIGSGMSSSAAVECAFAYAINSTFELNIPKKEIALIGQKAEHTFVGVMCGIMDQFASVFGKRDHVILLDCDTLDYKYYSADFQNYSLLLLDSKVKHTNLTSGYNDRRTEVETGLRAIREHNKNITSFRDCTIADVNAVREIIGETIYNRCVFVVEEIQRVLAAVSALEAADFQKVGSLMFQTHEGLSSQYEVSCDETDYLVAIAQQIPQVIGSRMMGGGFGGCIINLVEKGSESSVIKTISASYLDQFNIKLEHYQVSISDGSFEYKQ